MFGEEGAEPILGLTVLQSLGFLIDAAPPPAAAFRARGGVGLAASMIGTGQNPNGDADTSASVKDMRYLETAM